MATVRGNLAQLKRQPGGRLTYNTDGSVKASETFMGLYVNAIGQSPKRYITPHPLFPNLICNEVEIEEVAGGLCRISVNYFGPATGLTDGGPNTTPQYSLGCQSATQPIETFPDFSTTIGTTGNGATFDDKGNFIKFLPTSTFKGISTWEVPGLIWQKRGFSSSAPSSSEYARVGKIDTPEGPVATPTGRNWLLKSFESEQSGQIWPYVKRWELSGADGWNTTIYT